MTVPKSNSSRIGRAAVPGDVPATAPTDFAVFFADQKGNISAYDETFSRLLGWIPNELRGRNLSVLFSHNMAERAPLDPLGKTIVASVSEQGRYQSAVWLSAKSGKSLHARLSVTLVRDHTSAPTGMVGKWVTAAPRMWHHATPAQWTGRRVLPRATSRVSTMLL